MKFLRESHKLLEAKNHVISRNPHDLPPLFVRLSEDYDITLVYGGNLFEVATRQKAIIKIEMERREMFGSIQIEKLANELL